MNFKYGKPKTSRAGCLCGGKWDKKVTGNPKRKYEPELEEYRSKRRTKKDRRRWCGGKVGVEHIYRWVVDRGLEGRFPGRTFTTHHETLTCENCGRQSNSRTVCLKCGDVTRWFKRCKCPKAA